VYRLEFANSVYFGFTTNLSKRKEQHKKKWEDAFNFVPLYKYSSRGSALFMETFLTCETIVNMGRKFVRNEYIGRFSIPTTNFELGVTL